MMYSYPFRYPYYYGTSFRRPHNSFSQPNTSNDSVKPDNSCIADTSNANKEKTEKRESVTENRNALNFLGITLYFDDLLLLALIYFLYKEDVQDPELFIALILLLLS